MYKEYIAYLTGNRREITTSSPKALLINIEKFRDHCWVPLKMVENLRIKGHQKPVKVLIIAKEVPYLRRGTEQATTLKIKEIRRIK